MRGSFAGRAALGAAVFVAAQAAQAGTITGTVTYDGKVPDAEAALDRRRADVRQEARDRAERDAGARHAATRWRNVLVRVVSGLPAGKTYPAPTAPVTMDQNGCQYKPHVMGMQVGQPFKVLNTDGVLHNVHALPKVNATVQHGDAADAQGGERHLRQGRGHVRDQVRRAPLDDSRTWASSRTRSSR